MRPEKDKEQETQYQSKRWHPWKMFKLSFGLLQWSKLKSHAFFAYATQFSLYKYPHLHFAFAHPSHTNQALTIRS